MTQATRQIKVVSQFDGKPKETDFQVVDCETPKESDLKDNQLLLSLLYVSVDPYLRGRFNPSAPCVSPGIAKLFHSKAINFVKGIKTFVFCGMFAVFFNRKKKKTTKQTM